ncbi:minor tail protein [Microbacterium phage Dewdrop]|nr:minor tail protein [Microbacterium phage Leaf]QGZ17447.1 minor tail protein [Microbacterium phage Dewdrop]
MEMGSFGQPCISRHSVMIHDRGGKKRINQLIDVTQVKWGRTISDQVVAQITIAGKKSCEAQLKVLNDIEAMRHEIVIFRGADRVFEGPVLRVRWFSNRVVIMVKDVSQYLKGTSLSRDWPRPESGVQELMTDRMEEIINWELTVPYQMEVGTSAVPELVTVPRWETLDPPANVLDHLEVRRSTTLYTTSATLAFEMTLLDHLNDRARSALNWTTVGRKILIWDSNQLLGQTRRLSDADFYGEIEVYTDGSDFSSINHLSAQRDDEAGPQNPGVTQGVGHAGRADPYRGVWEYIGTSQTEEGSDQPTQAELNSQARRIDRARRELPLVMKVPSSSGLRLSKDLGIMQLVPGMVMPVSATFNLREVAQDQLLESVTVEETPKGETIQVTLQPAGPVLEVV